jgi:hypothetical protein
VAVGVLGVYDEDDDVLLEPPPPRICPNMAIPTIKIIQNHIPLLSELLLTICS